MNTNIVQAQENSKFINTRTIKSRIGDLEFKNGFPTPETTQVPGRGWTMSFRLYGPLEAFYDQTWKLNDIEEIQ